MEKKVITAVAEADEPLLQTLGTDLFINKYIDYDNTNADDLALIKKMSVAARELSEEYTSMALAEQVIQVFFSYDELVDNNNRITIPYCPFSAMVADYPKSKTYDGTLTALTLNDGYYLFGDQFKDIYFSDTAGTVGIELSGLDYLVRFTAGYGITGVTETLPEPIRLAMAKQVAEWWDNRSNYYPILSERIKEMLFPYRKIAWFN